MNAIMQGSAQSVMQLACAIVLTMLFLYGAEAALEAFPLADFWLNEKFGPWGRIILVFATCVLLARRVSQWFAHRFF